ncbi:hypothetical protein OG884_05575 [Streptosporangium sp. NBC_01755]|uniref:hypothetical protein n=1 Tax=Streptosporangium sp. NBC_01755 TaxID=2975949 RepID=UPI002DDBD414|nr:hypothetical protein [Streptosporangium sp. NBC_01755]WSD01394.1 hypothetical protein OG884_05575 [Streptosporangium sp. NBC_01755]
MSSTPNEQHATASPDSADPLIDDQATKLQYGVRWTPSHSQHPVVATSPDSEIEADSLARRLRSIQRVLGNDDDAVVVYRMGPDGEWDTAPPNPFGFPEQAEALLQDFLLWAERNPGMLQLLVDELLREAADQPTP